MAQLEPIQEILGTTTTDLARVLMEAGKPYALLKTTAPADIQATTQQLVQFLSLEMRS